MVKVSPSILSVSLENLENEIKNLEASGADYIHIDVMDGEFVKNETNGLEMIEIANNATNLPLDTHLMVENPKNWIEDFSTSDIITFHIEAVTEDEANEIIDLLHEKEIKAGISIKPETEIDEIKPYLDKVDMVLVMTVEPGMGGQKLIPDCIEKIAKIREIVPDIDIEVDGGINLENVELVKRAGANVIVAGTSIINASDKSLIIEKMKA